MDFPQIQALVLHKKQTITPPQKPWTRPFIRTTTFQRDETKRPNPNMLWQFSNRHPPWDSPEFTLILIFINGLGSQAHFQFLTEDKFYQGSIWSSHLGTGGQYRRALLLAGITSGWIVLKAFWYTVYSSNVVWCDEWLIWEGDCVHSDRPTVKPTTGVKRNSIQEYLLCICKAHNVGMNNSQYMLIRSFCCECDWKRSTMKCLGTNFFSR